MSRRHNRIIFWMGGLIFALAMIAAANTQPQNSEKDNQQAQEIQIRGSVVCLAEEMHELYNADLPPEHEHLYGFKTREGVFYTLLRTNLSEALFVDEHLCEKELIIKGRTFPKTRILEAISLQSVYNEVVHELYYYCETIAKPVPFEPLRRGIVYAVRLVLNWLKCHSNSFRCRIKAPGLPLSS